MLQSFLSPIRSRFDNVRLRNGDMNDPSSPDGPTSPHPASLLSPRSPFAWGVPSPALSVFGAQTLPQSSGTDQEDMANAEEFARDVLVELMRGLLEDLRTRISSNGEHISPDDVQEQIKVGLRTHFTLYFSDFHCRFSQKYGASCDKTLFL